TYEKAASIWPNQIADHTFADSLDQLLRRSLVRFDTDSGRYCLCPLLKSYLVERPDFFFETKRARIRFCTRMFDVGDEAKRLFEATDEARAIELLDEYYPDLEVAFRLAFSVRELHHRVRILLPTMPHYWVRRNKLAESDK